MSRNKSYNNQPVDDEWFSSDSDNTAQGSTTANNNNNKGEGSGGDGDGGGIEEDGEKKKSLVVRSNWKGYLQEFKSAVEVWGGCGASFNDFHAVIGNGVDGDEWHPKASKAD